MQEWKNGIWDPTISFYSMKIRNMLNMGSCNDMQGDNTDHSMFTIPNGPDQQSAPHCWPFDHAMIRRVIIQTISCSPFLLAQIKNQSLIHLKHSLNTFSPYLLQPLRWMQTSSEPSVTETTERRCKNTKTRSTWTMKHHESSKLEHITECHDLDRQSEL